MSSRSLYSALHILLEEAYNKADWESAQLTSKALLAVFGTQEADIPIEVVSWANGRQKFKRSSNLLLKKLKNTRIETEGCIVRRFQSLDIMIAAIHSGATECNNFNVLTWMARTCSLACLRPPMGVSESSSFMKKTMEALNTLLRFGGNPWFLIKHLIREFFYENVQERDSFRTLNGKKMWQLLQRESSNDVDNGKFIGSIDFSPFLMFVKVLVGRICSISDVNSIDEQTQETLLTAVFGGFCRPFTHTRETRKFLDCLFDYLFDGFENGGRKWKLSLDPNSLKSRKRGNLFHAIAKNIGLFEYFMFHRVEIKKPADGDADSLLTRGDCSFDVHTRGKVMCIQEGKLRDLLNDRDGYHRKILPFDLYLMSLFSTSRTKRLSDDYYTNACVWALASRLVCLGMDPSMSVWSKGYTHGR